MEARKRRVVAVKDVIESFSEEGLSLSIEQAEQVLAFLRGLAKVVVNDYLKEPGCKRVADNDFNNT